MMAVPGRTVIGFCGSAGAGKDEAAAALTAQGFVKRSFAEALRGEIRRVMTDAEYCDRVWHEMPEVCRRALLDCRVTGDLDPWRKPTSTEMRRLLQVWGTEFRRAQDPEYWIKAESLSLPDTGCFVYTDVRFPNEAAMISNLGGCLYRVERDGVTGNGHISELHWPHFKHDGIISNNGTVEELHAKVIQTVSIYDTP